MMKKDKLLEQIREKFELASTHYHDDYQRGEEDTNFAFGDQWPEDIKRQRQRESRPCLTENRILAFVNLVVNEIRQSRLTVNVKPVDSVADPEVAEIMQGLVKNIEVRSDAETAYDTAAANAVRSGYGFLRVCTDYVDDDSFDQEIKIERVLNPFSVMLDPNSTSMDGRDAEYAFIVDRVSSDDFEQLYPDADKEEFDSKLSAEGWGDDESVRVVEYFYKCYEKKKLIKFRYAGGDVQVGYKDEYEDFTDLLEIIDERDVDVCRVKYCKATANQILEEGEFPGKYIPIVPVYGQEAWYDGKRQVFSLINQAKDPQRMFNYWKTASTEVIALQPKAPWVGAKGQFKSNRGAWLSANTNNVAFMEYDPVTIDGQLAPPPQRQSPPQSSGGMMQEAIEAASGIQASLGVFNDNQGAESNGISGKAIIARQVQGDNATFHFVDNLATSMKHLGRILVDIIPTVYSEQHMVRVLGEDSRESLVPLNRAVVKDKKGYRDAEQGEEYSIIDLAKGKYDVVIEIGASYATKRQELSSAILELMRAAPEIKEIAGDILVGNLDMPRADELSERIRATMNPELLGDDLEAQRLQQQQQTIEQLGKELEDMQIALQAKQSNERDKIELERQKLSIENQKAQADIAKTLQEIEKMRAEVEVEIPAQAKADVALALERMNADVADLREAFEVFLDDAEERAVLEMASGEPQSPDNNKEEDTDDDRE